LGCEVTPGLSEMTSLKYVKEMFLATANANRSRQPSLTGHRTSLSEQRMKPRRLDVKRCIADRYRSSTYSIRFVRPAIAGITSGRFSGVVVGGHTIETAGFLQCVINYFVSRGLAGAGPLVTFPISISAIGVKMHHDQKSLLKRALACFNLLFVRGPHSYEILSEYVPKNRIRMALDSGFGVRLLLGRLARKRDNPGALRVAVTPRIDFFSAYHEPELRSLYMDSLARVVRWMIRKKGAKIYLVPQSLRDKSFQGLDDTVAIRRLLVALGPRDAAHITSFTPKSLADAYSFYNSIDLLITSRMHGGIMAMSAGSPVLFLLPTGDTKVNDVLASLNLNSREFMIDLFDAKQLRFTNMVSKVSTFMRSHNDLSRMITRRIDNALPQVELPAKTFAHMLS